MAMFQEQELLPNNFPRIPYLPIKEAWLTQRCCSMLASFRADMLPHFPVVALSADADVRSRKRSPVPLALILIPISSSSAYLPRALSSLESLSFPIGRTAYGPQVLSHPVVPLI